MEEFTMEKKQIDWANIGFNYIQTDKRYVSNYKDGAWDEGGLTEDANIVLNECAGVLQYAQTVFEGLKAYTTEDGHIVTFRPAYTYTATASAAIHCGAKVIFVDSQKDWFFFVYAINSILLLQVKLW